MPWNVAQSAQSKEQTRLEMQALASQFGGATDAPGLPYLRISAGERLCVPGGSKGVTQIVWHCFACLAFMCVSMKERTQI